MTGDETLIGRVTERINRERYQGPERRDNPSDILKWLPLAIAVVAGLAGYFRMEAQVQVNQRDIAELREADKAQWSRISGLMGGN